MKDLSSLNKYSYDLRLISEYRSVLMGFAILGVMLAHFSGWSGNPLHIKSILGPFCRLVFTEGFLFLSGFSLFYSFHKKPDVKVFYRKRFMRLFIPFLFIVTPFYVLSLITDRYNIVEFVLSETSLYFFLYGNNGMWYISITLFMYLLYPFLYKMLLAFGTGKVNIMTILMIVMSVVFLWLIHTINIDYYNMTHIGFSKIPMFLLGMCLGYHSYFNKSVGGGKIFILILIFIITYTLRLKFPVLDCYSEMLLRIIGIMAICLFFYHLKTISRKVRGVFEWFGDYSLELYILHMQLYYFLIKPFLLQYSICQTETGKLIIAIMTIALSIALCKPIHILCDHTAKTIIQK